jgi:hypothetical protein
MEETAMWGTEIKGKITETDMSQGEVLVSEFNTEMFWSIIQTLNNLFLACYTFGRLIIIVGVLFGLKARAFPPTTFVGELKGPFATKVATPGGAKRRFRFFKTDFKTALLGSVGVSIITSPKVTRISSDAIKS